jgi:hypothetical protein
LGGRCRGGWGSATRRRRRRRWWWCFDGSWEISGLGCFERLEEEKWV